MGFLSILAFRAFDSTLPSPVGCCCRLTIHTWARVFFLNNIGAGLSTRYRSRSTRLLKAQSPTALSSLQLCAPSLVFCHVFSLRIAAI